MEPNTFDRHIAEANRGVPQSEIKHGENEVDGRALPEASAALLCLFQLLETYAPTWYTTAHRDMAANTLQKLGIPVDSSRLALD